MSIWSSLEQMSVSEVLSFIDGGLYIHDMPHDLFFSFNSKKIFSLSHLHQENITLVRPLDKNPKLASPFPAITCYVYLKELPL